LIDSEPWYKSTEVAALNDFGMPITIEEMEEFTGLTLPVWLKTVNERYEKSVTVGEFLECYRPEMEKHVREDIQMFDDAPEYLAGLEGAPSILVTSSMKWYVDIIMERFSEIAKAVKGVVCEADVKIGKPDAEPYLKAAQILGVDPKRALVIEDAPNGVKSGIAAGSHVVGLDRYRKGNVRMAHRVVHSLAELSDNPVSLSPATLP